MKKEKDKEVLIRVVIDKELIEIMNKMRLKLSNMTYDSLDKESYRKLSKILARKIKDSGVII
jgi:hypothetical protein